MNLSFLCSFLSLLSIDTVARYVSKSRMISCLNKNGFVSLQIWTRVLSWNVGCAVIWTIDLKIS